MQVLLQSAACVDVLLCRLEHALDAVADLRGGGPRGHGPPPKMPEVASK